MNKVFLSGYISSDVDLRVTKQSGKSVATFHVAVRRPKSKDNETDFHSIVCWGSTAEFVAKYFSKGSGIELCGVLTNRSWIDKDGNKRYSTEIMADEVDFGKKAKQDKPHEETAQISAPAADANFVEISDDDDLPF